MFLVTFTCSLTYLVTQQSIRLGANELPAQAAHDTAYNLQHGQNPTSSIPVNKIDITKSMDTFVMIFDKHQNLLATSGRMNNQNPSYPKGVLDTVKKKGEDRVTWETKTGLRFATVAIQTNHNYIVAAHSLYETEKRIDSISKLVLLAWTMYLICSVIAFGIIFVVVRKINRIQ
ncbi:hypothetical protein [Shimazuella soli]|uniref:hypothetical protein n=1 Tax=Shimazuella soli TaxID=1892854 RepID=UPI001F104B93|nr:hypothetical protein [Shimazuella soli]